jgi:N-acetylmuramoyl-L-alanine amidase
VVIAPDAPPAPGAAATPAASPPSAAAAVPAADSTAPAAPTSNVRGGYSLARQLGLGASRIVIDPGHGGYDPGAMVGKTTEAAISLDIALQLEKLLLKQPGIEVILTRRADTFLALQERTEIANRERADLFISIHVNASRNKAARGVETFLLDFASTPDAEAVAARENASSSMTMSHLNELVKKIALTTKADESRDLAVRVQRTMVRRLKPHNSAMRDLGVRSAPFVVLIGASMPSILVETAFLTHKQEGKLLARPAYRQHVAEALDEGVRHYLQSLKRVSPVVQQPGPAGPAGRPGGGGTREPLQYP